MARLMKNAINSGLGFAPPVEKTEDQSAITRIPPPNTTGNIKELYA
jgi:hypothetical protein